MHREMGQPSLVESLLPQTLGRNERLERIRLRTARPASQQSLLGTPRKTQLPSGDDGQVPADPPVVQPVGSPDGGGPGRPHILPPLRRLGTSRRHAGPLYAQSFPQYLGEAGTKRKAVRRVGESVGRFGPGLERGNVDGCYVGGGAGASAAGVCVSWDEECCGSGCGLDAESGWASFAGIAALAASSQRVDSACEGVGREGVRHSEAQLWVHAGTVSWIGKERCGDVVQVDGVQPASCGQVVWMFSLNRG